MLLSKEMMPTSWLVKGVVAIVAATAANHLETKMAHSRLHSECCTLHDLEAMTLRVSSCLDHVEGCIETEGRRLSSKHIKHLVGDASVLIRSLHDLHSLCFSNIIYTESDRDRESVGCVEQG